MSRRNSYSDTFTGAADEGIRLILEGNGNEDNMETNNDQSTDRNIGDEW